MASPDIQAQMAAQLRQAHARPSRKAAGPKAPPAVVAGPHWVVASLDGPRPLVLCRDSARGHWVVATDPRRAMPFGDEAEAKTALEAFERQRRGHVSSAGGTWEVVEMTVRTTFRRP